MLAVEVQWSFLDSRHDPLWQACFCLYAYLHPVRDRLLYVGKADRLTVRQRLRGKHKDDLFKFLWERHGIEDIRVMQGELYPLNGHRRSSALLTDCETLLIHRLLPIGNISNTVTRIYRPGLHLRCTGDWPLKRRAFRDWS